MLENIIIPMNCGEQNKALVEHVASLGIPHFTHVTLLGIMCSDSTNNQFADPVLWNTVRCESQTKLSKYGKYLNSRNIATTIEIIDASSIEEVFNYVQNIRADLIVTTINNSGDWLVGGLLKHSKIPLLVVHEHVARLNYKNILVPLDGSQRAESGLNLGLVLAKKLNAQLHLGHIVQQPEMPRKNHMASDDLHMVQHIIKRNYEEAELYLQQIASNSVSDIHIHVSVEEKTTSGLAKIIAEQNIDLLVLSAHGYAGDPESTLGSVADSLLRHSHVPTVILQDLPAHIETTQPKLAPTIQMGHTN
ncbi:MAG: universal stress protein [Aggregatilineales bacterium]